MVKKKSVTYKVWRESTKGSDTYRSFRSVKSAAKHAIALNKIGKLNDITIAKGRGYYSERRMTKPETVKLNKFIHKFTIKRRK